MSSATTRPAATVPSLPKLVGSSAAITKVMRQISQLARSSAPVLVQGDTGTGKELVARLIHSGNRRSRQPFVSHNCGATPDTLIESELFGHTRGAFTGAVRDKPGLFEQAAGGTLFLDEIGDISPLMQVKLLRVLQEHEYRRLGETRTRRADVRLIAATNKALESEVAARRFRLDLYYRLHVLTIQLPPLAERPGDVPELIGHFAAVYARAEECPPFRLSPGALAALVRYPWPGNVRELENEVRRLVALHGGQEVRVADLSPRVRAVLLAQAEDSAVNLPRTGLRAAVVKLERRLIADALVKAGGNKSRTARELGLSRQGLAKKMRRYGMRWTAGTAAPYRPELEAEPGS